MDSLTPLIKENDVNTFQGFFSKANPKCGYFIEP